MIKSEKKQKSKMTNEEVTWTRHKTTFCSQKHMIKSEPGKLWTENPLHDCIEEDDE